MFFENTKVNEWRILCKATDLYNEYKVNPRTTTFNANEVAALSSSWTSPPFGSVKVNIDGVNGRHAIAAGVVIRDEPGNVVACQGFYEGDWGGSEQQQALEAEVQAFLKGFQLVKPLNLFEVILKGESRSMVDLIKLTSYGI